MFIITLLNKTVDFLLSFKDRLYNWKKGYGFIPTLYYADPKRQIALKVLPILQAYRKLIVDGKNYSLPEWVVNNDNVKNFSESQLNKIWLEYITKMIHAFELILAEDYKAEYEVEIDKGLALFSTYYQHLWD